MLRRLLVCLATGWVCLIVPALAQETPQQPRRGGSLVERLERFRKSLLIEPKDANPLENPSSGLLPTERWSAGRKMRAGQARSGENVRGPARATRVGENESGPRASDVTAPKSSRRDQSMPAAQAGAAPSRVNVADRRLEFEPAAPARPRAGAFVPGPTVAPPNRRLPVIINKSTEEEQTTVPVEDVTPTREQPDLEVEEPDRSVPTAQQPTPAKPRSDGEPQAPELTAPPQQPGTLEPEQAEPAVMPQSEPEETSVPSPRADSTYRNTTPPEPRLGSADRSIVSSDDVLFTQQAPHLTTRVSGPRTTTVGRPAAFRATVTNQGTVAAHDVVVKVTMPAWAKLTESKPTKGTAQMSGQTGEENTLVWMLPQLEEGGRQHLELKIVPHRGQSLELIVLSSHAPPASRAIVEVQEPRLEVMLTGPSEALYGETKRFELMLSNPGTGIAENVVVHLLRIGGGDRVADEHQVGSLQPGMSRRIDVELDARQAGTLLVKAQASAEGGLRAEATKEVLVRRAALHIDIDGPSALYAGTLASYRVQLSNPGTAAAQAATLTVALPTGAKFADCSEGGTFRAEEGKVAWSLGALDAEAQRSFELKCLLQSPGKNRMEAYAEASGELSDSAAVTSDVVAVADLALDVSDPPGPVPVGEDATFEIQIRNRGTLRAERIDVVAFFSDGIEPASASGAGYEIGPGQVVFRTIDGLDAGRELVLTVKAKSTRPGNHICRTELVCRSADIKLADEETTRFYGNPPSGSPHALTPQPADQEAAPTSAIPKQPTKP